MKIRTKVGRRKAVVVLVTGAAIALITTAIWTRSNTPSVLAVATQEQQTVRVRINGKDAAIETTQAASVAAAGTQLIAIRRTLSPQQALLLAQDIARCTNAASLAETDIPTGLTPDQQREFRENVLGDSDCSALESEHSIYDLAYYAASDGDSTAKLMFSGLASHQFDDEHSMFDEELVKRFKEATVRFLNEAADSGDSNALMLLAATFEDGLHVPRDAARAHAYARAFSQASGGKGLRYAERLWSQLSPDQQRESNRWHIEISNRRKGEMK
ncbi:hypothetical protein NJG17_11230 [Stenotrophomonas maltophilia]|jgi:hypothetical protein|uniref:hypothetical protein n=1 Tax=Stenotrophomonas maltophilia TaxID=40324 RepID=UPI00131347C0|nr:hypothetical protein [Stenotrophomonas maltophilia]MBN4996168.1 hypothetical protein [Stenotrophomonas maltophilia]MCO7500472.1 hypothetical protein [Stenotrophomonas maltophilia]